MKDSAKNNMMDLIFEYERRRQTDKRLTKFSTFDGYHENLIMNAKTVRGVNKLDKYHHLDLRLSPNSTIHLCLHVSNCGVQGPRDPTRAS